MHRQITDPSAYTLVLCCLQGGVSQELANAILGRVCYLRIDIDDITICSKCPVQSLAR